MKISPQWGDSWSTLCWRTEELVTARLWFTARELNLRYNIGFTTACVLLCKDGWCLAVGLRSSPPTKHSAPKWYRRVMYIVAGPTAAFYGYNTDEICSRFEQRGEQPPRELYGWHSPAYEYYTRKRRMRLLVSASPTVGREASPVLGVLRQYLRGR